MIERPAIEVCFSPALLHLYDTTDKVVVIIDIFRATSTITTALHHGASSVIPVPSVQECIALGLSMVDSITAGERDGKVAEGLQYGNSPFEYPAEFVSGKTLILTTTNGTRLLHMIKDAHQIVIGSFLNLDVLCDYLLSINKSVLLGCSSWKDRFNLEDTLFAGAVVNKLQQHFDIHCDSAIAALALHTISGGKDYMDFLKSSAHYRRLSAFGLENDMYYCTTPNLHPVLPILSGNKIVISN